MKVSTLSNYLRPVLAVVDPELTWSCPRQVTADSGIDALTHAVEAYTATDFDKLPVPEGQTSAYDGRHPLGDCLAEKAIQLVAEHLVAAVDDGNNHEAREGMALAATLAGMAFSNCGVALVHALEYPLGGALHCSHGGGNGLLLPFVMRFNLPEREETFARIAELLGEDIAHGDTSRAAEQAIEAVERLKERIGVPLRIRDLGGRREQLPEFADKSYAIERLRWTNPRSATRDDLLGILEDAF
jgi:alcohol dehydrogenase class IV